MDLKVLIPPRLLTNFEIQKYYQNEPRFNGVYSRDNLTDKIKNGTYVINLDEYSDIGTHWIAFYEMNLELDMSQNKFKTLLVIKILRDLRSQKNIFGIKTYDSVMSGYFCVGFFDFVLKGKSVTNFTNIFSQNDLLKNDDIILKYFKNG